MNDETHAHRSEYEVVVVGAGPAGMMLAAELTLAGVDVVVVVERRETQDLESPRSRGDVLVATGRLHHGEVPPPAPRGPIPKHATPKQRMARKLRTKKGKAAYARRKAIVEPVFGQIATCQGGKKVLLRGLAAADAEWALLAACHNLRKLFNVTGTTGLARLTTG